MDWKKYNTLGHPDCRALEANIAQLKKKLFKFPRSGLHLSKKFTIALNSITISEMANQNYIKHIYVLPFWIARTMNIMVVLPEAAQLGIHFLKKYVNAAPLRRIS